MATKNARSANHRNYYYPQPILSVHRLWVGLRYTWAETMVDIKLTKAGYYSSTERAKAVRAYFEAKGVDTEVLSVRDSSVYETSPDPLTVAVSVGNGASMHPAQFGRFMSAANAVVNDDDRNRYASDENQVAILHRRYVEESISTEETTIMSEAVAPPEGDSERYSVMSFDQSLAYVHDHEEDRLFVVEFTDSGPVVNPAYDKGDEHNELVGAVVTKLPVVLEGPDNVSVTVNNGDVSNGSSGSAGASDDDTEESGERWDDSVDVADADEKIEAIREWFDKWAVPMDDLDPDAIDIEAGAWDGEQSFRIEATPFPDGDASPEEIGYHDGSEWIDQSAFTAHREAFQELMGDEDKADEIDWYGEPHYENILPAGDVDSLTS